jgi:cytochrome c oxidase subunit 4
MNGFLNIGSLSLGICAWMIPSIILRKKNSSQRNGIKGILLSFICALLSLLMQMIGTKQLIDKNDWSALMDTQGVVVFGSIVMLVVVLVLNGMVWVRLSNSDQMNKGTKRSLK